MFRRALLTLFIALGARLVLSADAPVAPWDGAIKRDIEAFVARVMATGFTPGLAVGIVRGDDEVYAQGFGFADREAGRAVTAETQFYIASTTKSFTGLAAALLATRGELDLDASLRRYLPDIVLHPARSPDDITLRALLTHSHGIQPAGPVDFRAAYSGDFADGDLVRLLRLHPAAPTGHAFTYSNLGYNIFSLVLDARYKEGWKNVLQREVFAPLGMRSTTAWMSRADTNRLAQPYEFRKGRPERVSYAKADANMQAAGGHITSVHDLLRYLRAQLNEGRIDGRQALPARAIASSQQKQIDQHRTFGPFQRHGWGLGWDIADYEGDTILQRFGAFQGFRSHLSFMPERDLGVIVLSNGGGVSSPFTDLVATYVYDRLLQKPELEARYEERLESERRRIVAAIEKDATTRGARAQTTPLPWTAYAGTFESEGWGRMVWTLEEGRLKVRMGLAIGDVEVYDGARYQFRVSLTGSGSVVTFVVPAGAGAPTALRFADETFARVAP